MMLSVRFKFLNPTHLWRPGFSLANFSLIGLGVLWLAAAVAGFSQQPAQPAPAPAGNPSDPFAMDLDSLFNTKVTTASKFSEKLSDAAGVVTVVTQDELQRFGGATLLDVLERVAGLNVSSTFLADSSLIVVRGDQTRANAGHILILINGRPVREILEGGVSSDILESFPIGILERIEVVKGPGSVLYGSDAFSGVINLITKKAEGKDFRASVAGGVEGERSATEEFIFERGALNIVEGGQSHNWPEWDITEKALAASGNVTVQNDTLRDEGTGAYLGINYKGLSFMSSYTAQEAPSYVRGIVGDTRLKRGFSDLGYTLKAAAKWAMTFNGTYTRSVMDAPDYPTIHRDSYEGDLEWTNFITFSENDRLTFGTAYNHIAGLETYFGVTPSLIDAKGSRNASEAYVQFEHRLNDEVKLIGGVQANKIGKIDINAVPRGGILWSPSNRITMKVLYGGAYNAPSLDETLLNHPGLKGNPNLVPEKVGTLDAQLSYQSNSFQASVDYFHSRQTDLIIQNGAVFPAVYYNDPIPLHFHGVETDAKYYLKHDWFLIGSILYQVNDSGPGAKNLSPSPASVDKAGLSYKSPNGGTFSVFDAYQSQVAGFTSALNPPAQAFNSVSAHARYDLSKRWFKENALGVALFLNADDLLNKQIWLPALGSGTANTIPVVRGRTIFMGIEAWRN
jgi:outer membrane receptor for ferrienterochelin and colicins